MVLPPLPSNAPSAPPQLQRPCSTQCCLNRSTYVSQEPLWGRETLQKLIAQDEVRLVVTGNSVARSSNFSTARVIIEHALAPLFKRVTFDYATVQGGFEPHEVAACGIEVFQKADIVLIQYEIFSEKGGSETLLRLVLSLPRKPIIIFVQHCMLPSFDGSSQELLERNRQTENMLALHYNVVFVSACNAIDTLFAGTCREFGEMNLNRDILALETLFFSTTDHVHYNEMGSTMEGLLAASALKTLFELPVLALNPALPQPVRLENGKESIFCMSLLYGTFKAEAVEGWAIERGGAENSKQWWGSSTVNASLTLQTPPSNTLELQYYRHHSLPLGLLEVYVDQKLTATLDGCCASDCIPGLSGQGFYDTTVIAHGLDKTVSHTVTLRIIERVSTTCLLLGNTFNFVAVVGSNT